MRHSSDTGEPILSEVEQRRYDDASNALDVIDEVAPLLILTLDAFTKQHRGFYVSQVDWETCVGAIEDAIYDLFHNHRKQLEEIAGERPMKRMKFTKRGNAESWSA